MRFMTVKFGVAVALSLSISGITMTNYTASAAIWHKGTPSFFKNHHFRTLPRYDNGFKTWEYIYVQKDNFGAAIHDADGSGVTHPYYAHSGKTYWIKGKGGAMFISDMWTCYFKIHKYNSNHIAMKYRDSKKGYYPYVQYYVY